jgi:beta-propeller repeat-containing protein
MQPAVLMIARHGTSISRIKRGGDEGGAMRNPPMSDPQPLPSRSIGELDDAAVVLLQALVVEAYGPSLLVRDLDEPPITSTSTPKPRKRLWQALLLVVGLLALGTLPALASEVAWTRQFGTSVSDEALGVALDAAGNAYVVGWTLGTLPDQASAGTVDAFVRKYDPAGNELWTRQFGSWERDFARAVATDGAGNAYVVGETHGTLPGQTSAGGYDAFMRKYDSAGNEVWTHQFGGGGGESAWDVVADPAGNTYLVGSTGAALPDQASAGDFDAFVARYAPDGAQLWTRQFGSGGSDAGRGVALDPAGNVLVVGSTDFALPGQRSAGGFDAYLRQYDADGRELWTRQFGSEADDYGLAVAASPGGPSVVGSTDLSLPGHTSAGGSDAFLSHFDTAGTALWDKQFGTSSSDDAWDVAVDPEGEVYVVGNTERGGVFAGQRSAGGSDVFLRRYGPDGVERWTRQFGTSETDFASSLGVDRMGNPRVVGTTRGALHGQPSSGDRDAFVINSP